MTTIEDINSLINSLYKFVQNNEVKIISETFEIVTISINGSNEILKKIKSLYLTFKYINSEGISLQNSDGNIIELEEIDENINTLYTDFIWQVSINKVKWLSLNNFIITTFLDFDNYINWLENIEIFNENNEFIKYKNIQIVLPMKNEIIKGNNFLISNKIKENYHFEEVNLLPDDMKIKEYVHVISTEQIIFKPNRYSLELVQSKDKDRNLLYKNYAEVLAITLIQFFHTRNSIVLKGLKHLQLKLNNNHIPSIETIKVLEESVLWAYEENTSTRLQLLVDRLSFYEYDNNSFINIINKHIKEAFSEAKDRYKFVITEKSNEYTKDLKDLLKDTKEKADKYSDKTRAIITSLLRDTLGSIFFLGLTAYSRFSTNKNFMLSDDANIIFILLGSYFLLSMFLQSVFNFWDIYLSKEEAHKWSKSSMDYISEETYNKYVTEPLNIRTKQFIKVQFFIIAVYIILAITSFNVKTISNYLFIETEQTKKALNKNDVNKTKKKLVKIDNMKKLESK